MEIGGYTFANPHLFWLLLLIPILGAWFWWQRNSYYPDQSISNLTPLENAGISWRNILNGLLPVLRLLAIGLVIIALARPQTALEKERIKTKAIDIVLAMDVSPSMLAKDFDPNRLGAAKEVAQDFIAGRRDDRIGLVVFEAESFTQSPLTSDYRVLKNLLDETESGMMEDGTAIGMGLANAVNRLKQSEAESKVIILLTDGVNNRGQIDPLTAAKMAEEFGIKTYTIGIGSKGKAPFPVKTRHGRRYRTKKVNIDEQLLQQIADKTEGQYFRATDTEKLRDIYEEIDQLEKTEINVSAFKRYKEEFLPFAVLGALLFGLELISRYGLLKRLP